MAEAVVLLPGPGRRLDVVERRARLAPRRAVLGHLGELAVDADARTRSAWELAKGSSDARVLDEHRSDDTEERLVAGEDSGPAGEGVALKPSLERVLAGEGSKSVSKCVSETRWVNQSTSASMHRNN